MIGTPTVGCANMTLLRRTNQPHNPYHLPFVASSTNTPLSSQGLQSLINLLIDFFSSLEHGLTSPVYLPSLGFFYFVRVV
jgi:hypothetical protein